MLWKVHLAIFFSSKCSNALNLRCPSTGQNLSHRSSIICIKIKIISLLFRVYLPNLTLHKGLNLHVDKE